MINPKKQKLVTANWHNRDTIYSFLVENASKKLGSDFLTNYHLPQDFIFSNLDESFFYERTPQTMPIPLDDCVFDKFVNMEKKIINLPYIFNNADKNIQGCFLVGDDGGKPVLFALTIVRKNEVDTTIKLDVMVSGKEWLPVTRLDTFGPAHPNFYNDNCLIETEIVATPHIHKSSQLNQILSYDDLTYSTATHIDELDYENRQNKDNLTKDAINYFFALTNINAPINEKIAEDYNYSCNEPLFDYTKVSFAEYGFELYSDKILNQGDKYEL